VVVGEKDGDGVGDDATDKGGSSVGGSITPIKGGFSMIGGGVKVNSTGMSFGGSTGGIAGVALASMLGNGLNSLFSMLSLIRDLI